MEILPVSSTRSNHHRIGKIGAHHFAHLRAVAQGIPIDESARRYLLVHHGHEVVSGHRAVVDCVRALARRRSESAWRLIGLSIAVNELSSQPSLDDFVESRQLDGWSESEVQAMYAEAYPVELSSRSSRRVLLRTRQMALIRTLERLHAEAALPTDQVSGWFDDQTSRKLISAGFVTLGQLSERIGCGGIWYSGLPAIGRAKASRIASFVANLLPLASSVRPVFSLIPFPVSSVFSAPGDVPRLLDRSLLISDRSVLSACSDSDAVRSWVKAKAGSLLTAKAYTREAMRLMLWLQRERNNTTFARMTVEDCTAYMAFLQHIPCEWISRRHASPGDLGWAPFRGQLSHQSHRQAVVIVASLFTWLHAAQYLPANPWHLVNRRTGDDSQHSALDTRAFSESTFGSILSFVDAQPPSPATARIKFIFLFMESVGLRSAELIRAKLRDFRLEPEGWVMQVHGKGSKNRVVIVPGQALNALQAYMSARGLGPLESLGDDGPVLSSTSNPTSGIGYQALYEHVKSWLARAIAQSAITSTERARLTGASTHWLRHTFGTRAVARGVPLDVIQAQMGHASIQTVASIYGRAPIQRRADELTKAFSAR